jgi:hypothetical protein
MEKAVPSLTQPSARALLTRINVKIASAIIELVVLGAVTVGAVALATLVR